MMLAPVTVKREVSVNAVAWLIFLAALMTTGESLAQSCAFTECDPPKVCVEDPELGGAICVCPEGYTTEGETCQDIDECAGIGCDPLTTCFNTPGSYACTQCPDGYRGDGKTGCDDIDECAENNGGCNAAECVNLPGSHSCIKDSDADGVGDDSDSCVCVASRDQRDADRDGAGDACDLLPLIPLGLCLEGIRIVPQREVSCQPGIGQICL